MSISYRSDIDGLRALAVLSVIFFHSDIPFFGGGFVGVDVFFVISGFLITSIIIKEIELDDFSILRFYERRIRRIIPALVPLMLFVVLAGYYWLYPRLFEDLGDSFMATVFFVSNILFWHESGYFDAPALQKPLLHTWSLAVEEQFYMFYPLFLVMIKRFFHGNYKQWLLVATFISFFISVYSVFYKPTIAFYWFPPRAWELLVGGLLALDVFPDIKSKNTGNFISVAGLALIIYSIVFFTDKTIFPGHMALFPVLGSGLLIYAGKCGEHIVGSILKNRFFVFTGLLSYSMYLWHWPLIVFSKYVLLRDLYSFETIVLLACVFMVSYLSWRYVERPFRGKSAITLKRKYIFAASGFFMVFFAAIGAIIHFGSGMPGRLRLAKNQDVVFEDKKYVTDELKTINDIGYAVKIGDQDAEPVFLLWGDSHAGSLISGIYSLSEKYGKSGLVFSGPGVPPLLGVNGGNYINTETTDFNKDVFRYIENHSDIKTVILSARWCRYSENIWFEKSLIKTINRLVELGKKIVIVDDVPQLSQNLQQAYSVAYRKSENVSDFIDIVDSDDLKKSENVFSRILNRYKTTKNISVVYPNKMLVINHKMVLIDKDRLLYDDDNHLSQSGSLYIMPLFEDIIKNS